VAKSNVINQSSNNEHHQARESETAASAKPGGGSIEIMAYENVGDVAKSVSAASASKRQRKKWPWHRSKYGISESSNSGGIESYSSNGEEEIAKWRKKSHQKKESNNVISAKISVIEKQHRRRSEMTKKSIMAAMVSIGGIRKYQCEAANGVSKWRRKWPMAAMAWRK